MDYRRPRGERGVSFSLVGLLIAGLVIAYLVIKSMTAYLGSSVKGSGDWVNQTGVTLVPAAESGASVPATQGVLEWTRQEVKAAGQLAQDREKEFAEMKF